MITTNPEFVSGLSPHDAPVMSRDERNGCIDRPVLRQVGICRHCGVDMPANDWFDDGRVCRHCR